MWSESLTIECDGYRLEVTFDYSPGRPGVHTLRNGDPGYPDEPPEWGITSIKLCAEGAPDIELTGYGNFLDDASILTACDEAISEWQPDPPEDYEPTFCREEY